MKKTVLKGVGFILLFFVLLQYFTIRYMPEYFMDNAWPTTAAYKGFYRMEKDTVDVIFLGSSSGGCAFIPQELYNNFGISSYNLSCEQQTLVSSYYWLREALRYQRPGVVIIDSKFLFKKDESNLTDVWFRKAFSYMRMSPVKIEAIDATTRIINDLAREFKGIEATSKASWYFPIIRFHTRWEETGRPEGLQYYLDMSEHCELKGYVPQHGIGGIDDYEPVDLHAESEGVWYSDIEKEYLDRIVSLCRDNGIELILTFTPSKEDDYDKYLFLKGYAEEYGIEYIDFNTPDLLRATGYDFAHDNENKSHSNLWGAQRLTNYMGEYIVSNSLPVRSYENPRFEVTREYYRTLCDEYEMKNETDFDSYLAYIYKNIDKYYVFLSVRNDGTKGLSDKNIDSLRRLGLEADLKGQDGISYIACVDNLTNYEAAGYDSLEKTATVSSKLWYSIASGGAGNGDFSSIIVNGSEYSKNGNGINIVVFDRSGFGLVDSVVFDTSAEGHSAIR